MLRGLSRSLVHRGRTHQAFKVISGAVAVVGVALSVFALSPSASASVTGTTSVDTLLAARSTSGLQSLPADGAAALATAITAVGHDLGIALNPADAVASAHLPQGVSSRLAVLLQDEHACDLITAAAVVDMQQSFAQLGANHESVSQGTANALQSCAATMYSDGITMSGYLKGLTASPAASGSIGTLDVWPVINIDLSGATRTFPWDYVLIVDSGNATFLNNAGGNLIDVKRSPTNSSGARGCETVADFLGNTNPECVPASALVLQIGGTSNTFEQTQSPNEDARCTSSSVVRRIVTEGAAVAGVGILINTSTGTNAYLAKTSSQGAGHIGGVGILDVEGGTNSFQAIRNSQGFGFIGGLGLVHSESASNTVTYFPMPAGGIVDDTGVCNATPKHLQGSGEAGGIGAVVSDNDNPSTWTSNTTQAQGTGDLVLPAADSAGPGVGIFISESRCGSNSYLGVPGRTNGGGSASRIGPRADLTGVDFWVEIRGVC